MSNCKVELVPFNDTLEGMNEPYTLSNGLKYSVKSTFLTKINVFNEVIGIDTETFEGTCKLICISGLNRDGFQVPIKINNIYEPSFDDCLRILTFHINEKGVYRFFFNIDFDMSAILKLIYDDNLEKQRDFVDLLSKGIPMRYKDYRNVEYEFKWIRSKMFSIKVIKSKKSVVYTDLHSFYHLGLGIAGSHYLGIKKLDIIDAEKLNTDISYWKHKYDIIDYCIRDAELTAKLGKYLIDSLIQEKKLLPKHLVSSASISKQNYRFKNNIPNLKSTPIEIVEIAYQTYFGGRFEVFKRGFFNEAYLNDIVSEYPDLIKRLMDMYSGIWIKKSGKVNLSKKEPIFAFYKAKLNIPNDNRVSTIPYKNKNGVVCFPNGLFEKWFTWYDLDLVRPYIVEISECYEYVKRSKEYYEKHPYSKPKFPFKDKTMELFNRKQEIDKVLFEMNYNVNKITMNAVYGCFIETHENYFIMKDKNNNFVIDKNGKYQLEKKLRGGILFNPIYATWITSYGRWRLFKEIPKEKWNHIIAVHTDSIITDKNLSEYLDLGKNLGQWNIEGLGKSIVLNTGMYQVGSIVKTRGIPKKEIGNWLKFCLKYGNEIKKTFLIKHMKKVREAIIRDKSLTFLNTMSDVERSVSIDTEVKRTWYDNFNNFNDVLTRNIDSLPLVLRNNELEPNPLVLANQFDVSVDLIEKIIENRDDLN